VEGFQAKYKVYWGSSSIESVQPRDHGSTAAHAYLLLVLLRDELSRFTCLR
jgi:hypothetical protein